MSSHYAPPTNVDRHEFYIAFGFYVAVVIAIAVHQYNRKHWANAADKSPELGAAAARRQDYLDHFLGGKKFGTVALFLTLFSTIFSGYTVVGVVSLAAGAGFISLIWLISAPMVSLAQLILVPRSYALARKRRYDSPTDFVTDRFNDRVVQWLICLILSAQSCVYIVTQFYTINRLIPVLSGGMMNSKVTTWFMAAVMWFSEALGGFNAISKTDAIQSAIMIIALVAVPCVATYYYRGAGDSVDFDCENLAVVNCTGSEFTGTPCQGNPAYSIGCVAQLGPSSGFYTSGYKSLYPATDKWSDFFTGTLTNGADFSAISRGIDSNELFNQVASYMFGFNILFFAFSLNPHWIQRSYAAKTGGTVKHANMVLNFSTLIATLPGIFLGTMIAANLLPIRSAGQEPYGVLLNEFMAKEGFTEFVAVIAAVSVLAAIMSTVDSAVHGITNIVTSDFLKNFLFKKYPQYDTSTNMLNASRFISLFFIVLSCSVALYDDDLTDEDDGEDVYSNLISWQNALLWQVVPTMYLGMYMSKCKPWAHVAGIICGFATVIGLYVYEKDQQYWGSRYSVEKWEGDASDAKTWYFANGAGLWGGFANLLVTFLLNMLPGVESSLVPIHKGDSPHGEKTLTYADITETMKNTIEPIRSKLGVFCMITTFLLCNLSLPWYHEAYDGCNVVSLTQWFGSGRVETDGCDGPDMINGLPEWVVVIISCYIFAILSNTVAFSVWQPDPECNKPASSDELVGTQNTDTSKDEDTSKIEVKISSI